MLNLRLDLLQHQAADLLLVALLGDDASLESLTQLLRHHTEGNPFFLEESVASLAETGALAGEHGAYQLVNPIGALSIPLTTQLRGSVGPPHRRQTRFVGARISRRTYGMGRET